MKNLSYGAIILVIVISVLLCRDPKSDVLIFLNLIFAILVIFFKDKMYDSISEDTHCQWVYKFVYAFFETYTLALLIITSHTVVGYANPKDWNSIIKNFIEICQNGIYVILMGCIYIGAFIFKFRQAIYR